MAKKPNVRFAASDEPPPTVQMQPILDGLQKVLEAVLERKPEVKAVEMPESEGSKKGMGGNRQLTPTPSEASTNTSVPATDFRNPSLPKGRWNNDPPRKACDDTQILPQNSNYDGNRQNRSSSVDSQFRQPIQDSCPPPRTRKGCYVCGQTNCHSDLHLENPPPPGLSCLQTAEMPLRQPPRRLSCTSAKGSTTQRATKTTSTLPGTRKVCAMGRVLWLFPMWSHGLSQLPCSPWKSTST